MKKNRIIRLFSCAFFLLLAVWIATPKVYIHALLNHNHTEFHTGDQTQVNQASSADDCDFDKYDKPVYFNIFKFIIDFIPVRHDASNKLFGDDGKQTLVSFAISLLRAPPVH